MTVAGSRSNWAGVAGLLAALALAFPGAAYGWAFTGVGDRVEVARESTDSTAPVTVSVYTDYKGGETWSDTYPLGSLGSYESSLIVGELPDVCAGASIPLVCGQGPQLVVVSDGAGLLVTYAALWRSVPVGSLETSRVVADVGSVAPSVTSALADSSAMPVEVQEALTFGLPLLVLSAGLTVGLAVRRT